MHWTSQGTRALIYFFFIYRNLGVSGSSKLPDNYNFQLSPANGVKPVTPKQQRLCRKYPELIPYIGEGARESITQCQLQFKNRKWNCSAHSPENVFGKILKIGKTKSSASDIFKSKSVRDKLRQL